MGFFRVVEVFPPIFPGGAKERGSVNLAHNLDTFVSEVEGIKNYSDLILVASIKRPEVLRFSTIEAAWTLQERLGVDAAPVIVVRDQNRMEYRSSILTAISKGLSSVMLAWGDRYPPGSGVSNVGDYRNLAEAIADASTLCERASAKVRILAPIDIGKLSHGPGARIADSRLKSGADLLLAQPPTVDAGATYESHRRALDGAGLTSKVLLGIFPFRGVEDVRECERQFGWRLPSTLMSLAEGGRRQLQEEETKLVNKLKAAGHPGVYLSTRGDPSTARSILG